MKMKKGNVNLNGIWNDRFMDWQEDQIVTQRLGKMMRNQTKIMMYSNR